MKNISFSTRTLRGIMIALLLGAVQSFTLPAFATDITVSDYPDLQAKTLATGAAGDVIMLGGDITNGDSELTIGRDLTLDLNGKSLTIAVTAGNGIKIAPGAKLTIRNGVPGSNKLTATSSSGAGINTSDGALIINSGTVEATGSVISAGIGGSRNGAGGTITINGGNVTAASDGFGAGIGGGQYGSGGIITISGGTVVAIGGLNNGAGIGGGEDGAGGTITISGGDVTATGGNSGAGIGGGNDGAGGSIAIIGGDVKATGGTGGAGIGGGFYGDAGDILITGESTAVKATGGGNGAKDIGPGFIGSAGNVFVALPLGKLKNNSGNIGNAVQFTANPASSGTVTAALPTPFNQTINLLAGLNTTKTMSVITTQSVTFALSGYGDVSKTATELAASSAAVAFVASTITVTTTVIPGVTAPVAGATPVTSITETTQYTGTVSWTKADGTAFTGNFDYATAYRATITLTPKAGFTLTGVTANFFTVSGATATNAADGGVVTAVFPATASAPTYTVTIAPTSGGTVSASPASTTANGMVALTVTPASGYELDTISAYRTGSQATTVTLAGSGNNYSFAMPAYGVTVSATFKKTQVQLDREVVDAAKAAIEAGTYQVAQATANNATSLKTWLVDTLNTLFGQSHDMQLRSATSIDGEVTITAITPATAGTASAPTGVNGSFSFTATLNRGASSATASFTAGVIIATPYSSTTGIEDVPQSAKLYAVPTDGGLQIHGLVPNEVFSIYNMSGRLLFKGKATANEQLVPLRERGVYIVVSSKQRVKTMY